MGTPLIVKGMGSPVTLRLARLDNAEVATSTATFVLVPRSLDEQREWLTARSGAHAVVVADDEDCGVVGFAALSPWRSRPAYSTSVEDSIYVHAGHEGHGIGRTLLAELIEVATAHGFHAVFARIVGGHETSSKLHEAFGF